MKKPKTRRKAGCVSGVTGGGGWVAWDSKQVGAEWGAGALLSAAEYRQRTSAVGQGHDVMARAARDTSDQLLHVGPPVSHGPVSGGRWTLVRETSCQQIFGSLGQLRRASARLGSDE